VLGATLGSVLGATLGSVLGSTLGSVLGSTLGSVLGSTLGSVLGSVLGWVQSTLYVGFWSSQSRFPVAATDEAAGISRAPATRPATSIQENLRARLVRRDLCSDMDETPGWRRDASVG
jgi:phage tail tape-measure protein